MLVLFCLRRNQQGRNDAPLDVQDVFRLIIVGIKDHLFPFRSGQLELEPVPGERRCMLTVKTFFQCKPTEGARNVGNCSVCL